MECPAENTWLRYAGGEADDTLHAHLDGCAECRLVFAELARSERTLERGAQLGRYVVIDALGRGGMGIVYKAFDPELDRAIAVKLVALGGHVREPDAARQRLLREARTLAKLSHPNVVAVHDVGTLGDDVFVAMECVAGVTLRQWLRTPRTPGAILDVLGQAARGLAAAHRLAIVHRDFKPENVMIDDSGRARVLDFGLARSAGTIAADRAPTGSGDGATTRSGAVAGTPRYMAPEQAQAASAASDQFSFCVVLHEALYGERPAADARPPARRGVANRVRRALQIGLRRDPAERHASMDALGDALRPPRARVAVVAVGVAAVAIGAAVWTVARAPSVDSACSLAASDVGRVWNPARRAELVGLVGEPVAAQVDAWTAAWSSRRKALCAQALESDQDRSQDIAQQVGCLRRRLTSLDSAVSAVVHLRLMHDAPAAIARAGSPTVCDSYERGTTDETTRARWVPILEKIISAYVAVDAGRLDEAEAAASVALERARAEGAPDVLGGALTVRGLVQVEKRQNAEARVTLAEAIRHATLAREDQIVAQAWNARLLMAVHGDTHEVEAVMFGAEVAASKLPDDDATRCMTAGRTGAILALQGQLDVAIGKAEQALACWRRVVPARADAIAETQFVLGLLQARRGAWERARENLEASVAYGDLQAADADLATAHETLGTLALIREDDAAAERAFRRAREIARTIGGDAVRAQVEGHLAYVLVRGKRCADAAPLLASARALHAKVHGARSLGVASAMLGEAICAVEMNEPARARALLDVARPIIEASPSANASSRALADFTLARITPRKARAIALAEAALATLGNHPLAIHRREIEAWLAANR